jgi:hypothetical protein
MIEHPAFDCRLRFKINPDSAKRIVACHARHDDLAFPYLVVSAHGLLIRAVLKSHACDGTNTA